MATGRCVNIMRCSKAKTKEIIEVDKANFVCPECGKPLVECQGEVKPADKPQGGSNGGRRPATRTDSGGSKGKLAAIITAALIILGGGGFGIWKACSNGDRTDKTETSDTIKVDSTKVDPSKPDTQNKPEPGPEPEVGPKKTGLYNVSWASFDGTTLRFRRAHRIPGTSQVAQPGDKVTGVWKDGEVNSVRWYHADGSPSEVLTHE